MAYQNGSDAVVAAKEIPAANDEHRATRWFQIDGLRVGTCGRGDHTIPLMTNFDSSLPVFPS